MAADFDFVVIGGGSAGCIVASRLSAAGRSVLLLEAGGTDRRPDVLLPAGLPSSYKYCNWGYVPEPDPSRNGAVEAWPGGRVLGGSGSINGMVFVHGNPADFDSWAAGGATGWDYQSVLPYFRRMETWEGGGDDYRGGNGPIAVGRHTMAHPANDAFLAAAIDAGHPLTLDYNGSCQRGASVVQVNQRRGMRSHSSREYLRRVADKSRLTVVTRAFVDRIVFEGARAVGVDYTRRGKRHTARSSEVILSAGSIASPKVLMLSGVGPRADLEHLNVAVVHDSPGVGANLQEHLGLLQRWHSTVPTINHITPGVALKSVAEYTRRGTGNLAATVFHSQVMHGASPDRPHPDVQNAFASFAIVRDRGADGILHVRPAKVPSLMVSTVFVHPRQRGRIGLRSNNPNDQPVIEHQMMANRDDVADLLKGMAEARRIMTMPSMSKFLGRPFDDEGACQSDGDWEAFARANVTYGAHPIGTCHIGDDDAAVVDSDLRVHGVSGLRVVDASVMPTATTGNTNAPTMMIAERASDVILA